MIWLLLATALLAMLIMEVRIWRAVTGLIYRTGRQLVAPAKQKD
ncbi:hypothetical protein K1718_11750 [Roseibium porphyridii]|uniref:Uncharacterized protein n=1 Tax=Roseibium porphyridii TaxID=2866279 RepID=A0ABY8FBI9_9HYPH|nr:MULTISPECIES: hypothetical protein [Stappiaceae]QFT31409.1 hypothetical protein FIV00_13025 [Labrenzia sp. THAF82]WFE92004.1 hypothetical protein K1718_11750 [Roseibium sp. KMA01]